MGVFSTARPYEHPPLCSTYLKHTPYKTNVNNILQIFTIYLTQLIDKICEATKDKKQYIQMAKFISLVTTSLKPPFYNDIIKIIPNPTKKRGMLLNSL